MPHKDEAERKAYQKRWREQNKARIKERMRLYYLDNKEEMKAAQKERYNLPADRARRGLPEPTRSAPERCECCGKESNRMALDHCHETNTFRGWLCLRCNTGIGMLGDNLEGIESALTYLKKEG